MGLRLSCCEVSELEILGKLLEVLPATTQNLLELLDLLQRWRENHASTNVRSRLVCTPRLNEKQHKTAGWHLHKLSHSDCQGEEGLMLSDQSDR